MKYVSREFLQPCTVVVHNIRYNSFSDSDQAFGELTSFLMLLMSLP